MRLRNGKTIVRGVKATNNITYNISPTREALDIAPIEEKEEQLKSCMKKLSVLIMEHKTKVPMLLMNKLAHVSMILDTTIEFIEMISPSSDTRIGFVNAVMKKTVEWLDCILAKTQHFVDHACFKELVHDFAKKVLLCNMKILDFFTKTKDDKDKDKITTDPVVEKAWKLIKLCR